MTPADAAAVGDLLAWSCAAFYVLGACSTLAIHGLGRWLDRA